MAKEEMEALIKSSTELRTSTTEASEQPAVCLSRVLSTLESAGMAPSAEAHPEAAEAWEAARQALSGSPGAGRVHPSPKAAARRPQSVASSESDEEADGEEEDEDMEPQPPAPGESRPPAIKREQDAPNEALVASLTGMLAGNLDTTVRRQLMTALNAAHGKRRRCTGKTREAAEPVN